jgi:hypothetical protein
MGSDRFCRLRFQMRTLLGVGTMQACLPYANMGGSFFAALFWFISASIRVPDLPQTALSGPNSITGIVRRQSIWSGLAAACAGVSALAQAAIVWLH